MQTDPTTPFIDYPHLHGSVQSFTILDGEASLCLAIDSGQRHAYLLDHVFGREVYVPATFIMEIIAEAGAWFAAQTFQADDFRVVGLCDFSVERALTMPPGQARDARVLIRRDESQRGRAVRVEIWSRRRNARGETVGERRNACAAVLLGHSSVVDLPVIAHEPEYEFFSFPPRTLYQRYFPSLGPHFQTQVGRFKVDTRRRQLVGSYDLRALETSLIEPGQRSFLVSPLAYDTCLQYTVLLSRILMTIGRLPIGFGAIHFLRDHPRSGECRVTVRCNHIDQDVMAADFDVVDGSDQTVAMARDVRVRYAPVNQVHSIYSDPVQFEAGLQEHRCVAGW